MVSRQIIYLISDVILLLCLIGIIWQVERWVYPPVKCMPFVCGVAHCDCLNCTYMMKWQPGEVRGVSV